MIIYLPQLQVDAKLRPMPFIIDLTPRGEITIGWDKPMRLLSAEKIASLRKARIQIDYKTKDDDELIS